VCGLPFLFNTTVPIIIYYRATRFDFKMIIFWLLLFQCTGSASKQRGGGGAADTNQTLPTQRLLVDAQKFQMMDGAVQPTRLEPFVVAENERYVCLK